MEWIVETTVAYVKERHQFGRPLGALQAVHHACFEMATCLETTRLVTTQAAWLMSHPQTKERIKAIETLRAGWRQTPAKSAPDRQPN